MTGDRRSVCRCAVRLCDRARVACAMCGAHCARYACTATQRARPRSCTRWARYAHAVVVHMLGFWHVDGKGLRGLQRGV
eukprot:9554268-Alexandrium_andersonii.AAC.1